MIRFGCHHSFFCFLFFASSKLCLQVIRNIWLNNGCGNNINTNRKGTNYLCIDQNSVAK